MSELFEVVVGSLALFYALRRGTWFAPPGVLLGGKVTRWKWGNTANSLLHSLVTGVGALSCLYTCPELGDDVVHVYSPLAHRLTAFSLGYFIFDFFDLFLNHRKRSAYELMLHHAFVISCFGVSMLTRRYQGFVMVALVIEVNSVFLHWRQLLLLSQVCKTETYYRTISALNLCTFLLFRLVPLGWMARWLATNSQEVSPGVHVLGCVTNASIVIMSTVLLLRILKADFQPTNDIMAPSADRNENSIKGPI